MLPWQETSVEAERLRFIERRAAGEESHVASCRQFGISRKTGYEVIGRYEAYGKDGLRDRSRAPHHHPNATPRELQEGIIAAKRAHPTWGPKKLIAWLRDTEPGVPWPAPSTAGAILDRAGLVQRRRRRRRASPWNEPFSHATVANDVWAIDFKGWFRTGDGVRVDPLTVQDAASRYLIACRGLERPTGPETRRALARAFREYGLPRVIRTDNGPPFAGTGLGSLSPLAVWWVKLGILPERIAPGHPEQNGRLERLHRTLKEETASPPRANGRRQQQAFDRFRRGYNTERPHEALGQRPPALLYTPSFRPYPASVGPLEYGTEITVRRVRGNGEIKWKGDLVFVSETLKGEPIGLVQQDDRNWAVRFGPLLIGLLDDHTKRIAKTPVQVLPMSPV